MQFSKIFILTMLLFAMLSPSLVFAAEESAERTVVMIETDPVTFALDGFATHIRFVFPGAEQWTFGGGLYGMEFPNILVDLNDKNKDRGWKQRLKLGYGLFADRHFGEGAQGFFVGAQLAIQRYELSKPDNTDARSEYTSILFMPRAGYLWKPFENNGFYLMPWVGVGGTAKISGETILENKDFDIDPVLAFATLHIGWQF